MCLKTICLFLYVKSCEYTITCADFEIAIANEGTASEPVDACQFGPASHVYTKGCQVGLQS